MDKELAKILEAIPEQAPFSEVISKINEWAENDIRRRRMDEEFAYSPPLDF